LERQGRNRLILNVSEMADLVFEDTLIRYKNENQAQKHRKTYVSTSCIEDMPKTEGYRQQS